MRSPTSSEDSELLCRHSSNILIDTKKTHKRFTGVISSLDSSVNWLYNAMKMPLDSAFWNSGQMQHNSVAVHIQS